MIITDTHTHSIHSFDGKPEATVDAMCQNAISLGIKYLCITDHYEANYRTQYPDYPVYNAALARRDVFEAKEKYKDKLTVIYGIECGQITQATDTALEFLNENGFEFVLGSLHNTSGEEDPYILDMSKFNQEQLRHRWDTYLSELSLVADFDCFESMAHLTYPIRYCFRDSNPFDISYSKDAIAKILQKIIKKEMCLEVNSSGFRQKMGSPDPCGVVLELYRELGGELITIGSDGHHLEHMAFAYDLTEKYLKDLGYKHYHLKTKNDILTFDL